MTGIIQTVATLLTLIFAIYVAIKYEKTKEDNITLRWQLKNEKADNRSLLGKLRKR